MVTQILGKLEIFVSERKAESGKLLIQPVSLTNIYRSMGTIPPTTLLNNW